MSLIIAQQKAEEERRAGGVHKVYELKAGSASIEENTLRGNASVLGVMDRQSDVLFPGFYGKGALAGFLKDGFIAVGHDWESMPVAMPKSAKEDGQNLVCEAVFHSTPEAQSVRTVCMERIANGLSVGLSVGFMPDYEAGVAFVDGKASDEQSGAAIVYFDSGKSLLNYAKAQCYDMSLFDAKGIRACTGMCRGLMACKDLFEFSVVSVPANPKATATDVKGNPAHFDNVLFPGETVPSLRLPRGDIRAFEDFLRESGFSKAESIAIASRGFKAGRSDSEPDVNARVKRLLADTLARSTRLRDAKVQPYESPTAFSCLQGEG